MYIIQILTIDSSSIISNAALKIRKHFITINISIISRTRKLLRNSIDCTFSPSHTDHPSIVWISRCPTQTFITQENDWIFYTNTRIVGDLVWRIVDRESNDISIFRTTSKRLLTYKSEKRIFLLPSSMPWSPFPGHFIPSTVPFSFLPCTPLHIPLLLSICLPDSCK